MIIPTITSSIFYNCINILINFFSTVDFGSSIVGAIIGFIIAIAYEWITQKCEKKRIKNQFVELLGNYKSNKNPDLEIIAEIQYLERNFLKIRTTVKCLPSLEKNEVWEGEIKMETLSYGKSGIIYKDHKIPDFLKKIDLKTIIFNREQNSFTVFSGNTKEYPEPEYFEKANT